MNRIEKSDIKKQIFRTKFLNIEQNFLFFSYYVWAYINTKITFKNNSMVDNELDSALIDYLEIMKEEKLLMKLLIKFSDKIDYSEADYILAVLDEINDRTIIELFDYFDEVDVACDLNRDYRATRRNKGITIADTDEYRKMFVSLLLKNRDIKSFLDYPDEFWKSLSGKVQYTEVEDEDIWGIDYDIDDEDSIVSIILPRVINLDTALINIEIFEEAYSKYAKKEKIESRTEEFENVYLTNKTKKFFKKYN